MHHVGKRIEAAFESLGWNIYRNPWKVLLGVAFLSALLISQLPKITIDTTNEGFLHEEDPIRIQFDEFRDQFGRNETVVLAIEPPEVFEPNFLRKLTRLHKELEDKTPHLDEIDSLVNARNTFGRGDELVVEDFLEKIPQTEQELQRLRQVASSNHLYPNLILSEDHRFTTITLRLDLFQAPEAEDVIDSLSKSSGSKADSFEQADAENNDLSGFGDAVLESDLEGFEDTPVRDSAFQESDDLEGFEAGFAETTDNQASQATPSGTQVKPQYLSEKSKSESLKVIHQIVKDYHSEDFKIQVAGSTEIINELKTNMPKDIGRFLGSGMLLIGVLLFVLFRRLSGVLIPFLVVVLGLLATLSTMAATGTPIKVVTQILPSFLLAVGIGDSVHILAIFYRQYDRSGDKGRAISYALGHSGLAILMTSLTTAGGLLSFAAADLAPVADLGQFSPLGVMILFVYTVTLIPCLLAILPIKQRVVHAEGGEIVAVDRILATFGDFAVNHPWRVIGIFSGVLLFAFVGMAQLKLSHNPVEWFPKSYPARVASESIDKNLKGTVTLEVVIDTGRENGLYEPTVMRQLETYAQRVSQMDSGYPELFVGKTLSVVDVLKETNQALNENRAEQYAIPDNRDLIAQELLLFENSGADDLEDLVDNQFSKARLMIKVPWVDALKYVPYLNKAEALAHEVFDDEMKISLTGLIPVFSRTFTAMIMDMKESYMIAGIVITVLMALLVGSTLVGLVAMVPNFFPIFLAMGLMGWSGISLNGFTMLTGSIALGLAVDDTIHFMHNYRRYLGRYGNNKEAVHHTLLTTGRAMLFTTLVLTGGFLVLSGALMVNIRHFGLFTGIAIATAFLADVLLAPALMTLISRNKKAKQVISLDD